MKLKKVSCTQFAGIRDADVSFEDGINVVYGKNESGKSTLAGLIARTLFQSPRLDKRSDREFVDLYFPCAQRDGAVTGDFADGSVVFESGGREYTLSKEWGAEPRCTLSAPEGVLRTQEQIDAILADALVYGEGVYTDLLLPSQRIAADSLRAILDASRSTDAKRELSDAVTTAFAESGGVSLDAIERAIEDKIRKIEGLHWDFEKSEPVKRASRWVRDTGEILNAYYAMLDAEAARDELLRLQDDADTAAAVYDASDRSASEAEKALNEFAGYADRLEREQSNRESIARLEGELKKYNAVLNEWPQLVQTLKTARALRDERRRRDTLDRFAAVQALLKELKISEARLEKMPCPAEEEILAVKKAERELAVLSGKLKSINLTADMTLFGSYKAEARSLLTGEKIKLDKDTPITEAVSIVIPEVMELTLSPADVDTDAVREGIQKRQSAIEAVYNKYNVKATDGLERAVREHRELKNVCDGMEERLAALLGGADYEILKAQAKAAEGTARSAAETDSDIYTVCGGDVQQFIMRRETQISMYTDEYESIDSLARRADIKRGELKSAEAELGEDGGIPAAYLSITDPSARLALLTNDAREKQLARERALTEKAAAAGRLEAYRDSLTDDCDDKVTETKREFNEKKELLAHWRHIREVFNEKRGALRDNPMQDIARQLGEYLSVISGGTVSSEMRENRAEVSVYSKNRLMDYGKLSEGTKDTVFLAFRLAAVDHLFPQGGGVVVLDDPFTDMDAERTERSCALVREFARKHQVIFLTCDEKYIDMLRGKLITI